MVGLIHPRTSAARGLSGNLWRNALYPNGFPQVLTCPKLFSERLFRPSAAKRDYGYRNRKYSMEAGEASAPAALNSSSSSLRRISGAPACPLKLAR